eukprot:293134-Pyramimonas_sp.AAC.1
MLLRPRKTSGLVPLIGPEDAEPQTVQMKSWITSDPSKGKKCKEWEIDHKKPSTRHPTLRPQDVH